MRLTPGNWMISGGIFTWLQRDTIRPAIRLTHAGHKEKPNVLVPELKPCARHAWREDDDNAPS